MRLLPAVLLFAWCSAAVAADPATPKQRPLLRDFLGLCVHTVQFRPALYAPITRVVRDYHPVRWDLGEDSSFPTTFPMARNKVDWSKVYGSWKSAGYHTSASLMFDDMAPGIWKNVEADAFAYGKAFARAFGPGSTGLVEAAEIGNEPSKYPDDIYRKMFENMARGLREGDSKIRVATCATNLGPSGKYSKSVDLLNGLDALWDILNIHIYPEVEGWPTWRRSYPEDSKIKFLQELDGMLKWKKEHAPNKEVWLTEFGYDASTKPAPATGTFSKWIGNTDEQQAAWIVRGYLVLASTELDRAYLYFFNDDDTPQMHGSSGLTRKFQPKPSFHAVAHLQKTLGDYRLAKVHARSEEDGYVQEWVHGENPKQRVTVCWLPKGSERDLEIPVAKERVTRAEQMPLVAGDVPAVEVKPGSLGNSTVKAGERPIFVSWTAL